MGLMKAVMSTGAALALSLAQGAEWFEPHATYTFDVASAYISRGKVSEDGPIQINDVDLHFGLSDFGRIGVWYCDYSNLNGDFQDKHRRFMSECDWAAYYGYDWKFAEDWSLDTKIMVEWLLYYGGHPESSPSGYEWRMQQTLKNPYVVPYYKIRYTIDPAEYAYYQIGLKRTFKVCEWLRLIPNVATDFADARGREKRFGPKPDGMSYGAGILSLIAELTVEVPLRDWCSLHATVGHFDVLDDDGRDAISDSDKRDLTYGQVGFSLGF